MRVYDDESFACPTCGDETYWDTDAGAQRCACHEEENA